MLIGGALDALSGLTFQSENPYTGKAWAVVPDGAPEDVVMSGGAASRGGQAR